MNTELKSVAGNENKFGDLAGGIQSRAAFWWIAIVAQVCFFIFAMPVPQLLGFSSLSYGVLVCAVSVVTLGLFPLFALRRCEPNRSLPVPNRFDRFGLGWGDRSFGWRAFLLLTPAMAIGTFVGGEDQGIQAFYPFAGTVLGARPIAMLVWLPFLFAYYAAFEFFYRGVFLTACFQQGEAESWRPNRFVCKWILIQAVFCFLVHIGKPNIELAASFPASILFGWLAWRSRSIWYGVLIHFAVGIANDLGALWHSGRLEWFV